MAMHIDAAEANQVGLTPAAVTQAVSGALLGVEAGKIYRDDRSIGVRVRAPDSVRFDPLRLGAIPVLAPGRRTPIPVASLVHFTPMAAPSVVLLAAPLSFVGAMALLLVTRTALNVSSFMGLILLVGLIVKNGIILLDFTRLRMQTEHVTLEVAIREAARVRLRPILMTTLCTLFGLLPLALGIGAGSELQRPLALAVIGGLALSTPITLFAVPTLLIAIRGRRYTLQENSGRITNGAHQNS